jgi:ethanolamine utilization protein EutA
VIDGQALAPDVEGIEWYQLQSVGIDIGSSTSHLMISRLTMRRRGAEHSTQFTVSDRELLYQSPVLLTPYVTDTRIDASALQAFFDRSYDEAGVRPGDITTGAVVITGEALNRENAEEIAGLFAEWGGKFVCVSAGPHHEALMAAYGSGAVALSAQQHSTVLCLDIGGGTTKLSLVSDGAVLQTESFSVGARLVVVGDDGRVTRIESAARRMLRELGADLEPGAELSHELRERLAALMADLVVGAITGKGPLEPLRRELSVTELTESGPSPVDTIVMSGGVSEYFWGRDRSSYGDLGVELGGALRERLLSPEWPSRIAPAVQGIRATVVGASQYTVQASGQTSYISDAGVLPVRGLRAVKAALTQPAGPAAALRDALARNDLPEFTPGLALALSLGGVFGYRTLRGCADAIVAVAGRAAPGAPLFLLVDADLAHSLGGILKDELRWPGAVVALDGIDTGELDFVDIGSPVGVSGSLPVTVKSLVFPASAGLLTVCPGGYACPMKPPAPVASSFMTAGWPERSCRSTGAISFPICAPSNSAAGTSAIATERSSS